MDDELRDLASHAEVYAAAAESRGELAQARHWEEIRHAARQIVALRHRKAAP